MELDETFTLVISLLPDNVSISRGDIDQAIVTIVDDDGEEILNVWRYP